MSTLHVRNLTKRYGDVTALDDVSFTVESTEFVVLLGQSGAGKSTLLRCINGLTDPTSGSVEVDGDELSGSRSDVAMVFQQHNLVEELSAFANALTGSLHRTGFLRSVLQRNSESDQLRALDALQTVGLLDEAEQRVARMSGGQQQRVGISRALVQNPKLMLADEPVASLDPASAERVMEYLKKASREYGIATVTSLHQVNIARYFGDRFIGLRDGQVVFDGSRSELTREVIDDLYGEVETIGMGVPPTAETAPVQSDAAPTTERENPTLGEIR
ncbi:phosphonate ABC transporter ATP-binding protein [Halogeometricum borinquense]|uniref:Phosphonate ABC transporter ATP-binding protein n=1 Tax=Halogeometricum borinquense TaxID=60847 RepID=A0A6C0UGB0_9EURY|nr:phosphonate ABC transporter ATP-binding protein [Halogeometricum borinquense]QIB74260.1 phosphonate ABC transporter ATP-binding protein [Halogeometricum borinquense]